MVFRSVAALCGAAGVALVALAGSASAEEFTYTFNVAGTSDYIFRGFSQSQRDPTLEIGADAAYGIGYIGIWAAGINLGTQAGTGLDLADKEVDLYGGVHPVWKSPFGDVTFDLGVIYYWYPDSRDNFVANGEFAKADYVEGKAGYSTSFIKNLTTGTTVYFSPEGTYGTGQIWTVESTAAYTLSAWGPITPSISGTWGWVRGESNDTNFLVAVGNGKDRYQYWNAGATFAADKISLDLRYWDTDVKNNNAAGGFADGFCKGAVLQCDSTFVATVKVVLP